MDRVSRVLIVRLSSIGDVLMSVPSAEALKRAHPHVRITWVVEETSKPVVAANPWVDEVIELPKLRWIQLLRRWRWGTVAREVVQFARVLRSRRPQVAVDLQGLLRSALVVWLSGAPARVGDRKALEGAARFYTHLADMPVHPTRAAQSYVALLAPLGVPGNAPSLTLPISSSDDADAAALIDELDLRHPFAVLCPATTHQAKFWTPEGFAGVADGLQARYGLASVVLGARRDTPLAEQIASLASVPVAIATGRTSVLGAAAVIRRAAVVVSVDTGLLFASVAVGTPVVGLFGPTRFDHLAEEPVIVVNEPSCCHPCFRSPTCGDRDCMRAITPERVLAAVGEAIRRYGREVAGS